MDITGFRLNRQFQYEYLTFVHLFFPVQFSWSGDAWVHYLLLHEKSGNGILFFTWSNLKQKICIISYIKESVLYRGQMCNFKQIWLRRWHKQCIRNIRNSFSRWKGDLVRSSCVFRRVMKPLILKHLLRIQRQFLLFFFRLLVVFWFVKGVLFQYKAFRDNKNPSSNI